VVWWVGWIETVPGVNFQEPSRAALLETLCITLEEVLEATAPMHALPPPRALRGVRIAEAACARTDGSAWHVRPVETCE